MWHAWVPTRRESRPHQGGFGNLDSEPEWERFDVFDAKVRRKGKNALGIFVSVSGFTRPDLDAYEERTSFVTFDGSDRYMVLERRVRLDDLLRAKRRHANETVSCHLLGPSELSLGEGAA